MDAALPPQLEWVTSTPPGLVRLPFELFMATPGTAELPAEIDIALRTWALPLCSAFRGKYMGPRAVTAADDGINAVFWEDKVWPADLVPGAIAQAVVYVNPDGFVRDADIHLNAVDYTFSLDGREGTIDLRGILVHEIGHALGLGHTAVARATMAERNPRGLVWRSLEKDDREGVCALYPGTGDPGCEASACPDGYVCVARACERLGARGVACSPCKRFTGACEGAGDEGRCIDLDAGSVCARPCSSDAECGPRFRCQATTSSGDFQCVPTSRCEVSPCTTDAECSGYLCRDGMCVGPRDPTPEDAGPSLDAQRVQAPTGCSSGRGTGALAGLLFLLFLFRVRR